MDNFVIIGKVLKPKGLSGEIKIQILTNKVEVFLNAKILKIGEKSYHIKKSSVQNGFAYLSLEGVSTIEDAEKFRGKSVEMERSLFPLDDDEVTSDTLIGFDIVNTSGESLGKIKSVENYGSGDIFECAGSNGYFSFPNEDAFIWETNLTARKITIKDGMLDEEVIF